MKNTNVVQHRQQHKYVPGDEMDNKNRKPDHEEVHGKTKVRIFFNRIPANVFWSRVNPAIARCIADKAIQQESS